MDESDSLRQFVIPKRRASVSENLIAIDQNSFEFKSDVLVVIQQHFKHKESLEYFSFKNPHIVHNPVLLTEFSEKRKQMKEACNDKELKCSYAFLHVHSKYEAERICKEGLYIGNSDIKSLGDPNLGVYVNKYVDIVSDQMSYGYMVIFKMIKGKVKTMVENRTGDALEPTPGCDCHVVKSSNQSEEYEASQIYAFEYDNNMEVLKRPRHLLPFAMVYFSMHPKKFGHNKIYKAKVNRSIKQPAWTQQFAKGNENEMKAPDIVPPKKTSHHSMSFHCNQSHLLWSGSMIINNRMICSVNIYSDHLIACPFYLGPDIKLNSKLKTDMLFSLFFIDKLPSLNIREYTAWNDIFYTYTKIKCIDSMVLKFLKISNDLQDNDCSLLCSVEDSVKLILVPDCKQIEKLGLHDPSYLHAIFVSNFPNIYAPKSDYKDSLKQIMERINKSMPRPVTNKSDPRQMKKLLALRGSLSDWGELSQIGIEEIAAPIAGVDLVHVEPPANFPPLDLPPSCHEVQPAEITLIAPHNDRNETERVVAEPTFIPSLPISHLLPLPLPTTVMQINSEANISDPAQGPAEHTLAFQPKLDFGISRLKLSLKTLNMSFMKENAESLTVCAPVKLESIELPVSKIPVCDPSQKDFAGQSPVFVREEMNIYNPRSYDHPVIIIADEDDENVHVVDRNETGPIEFLDENWDGDDVYQDGDNKCNNTNNDEDDVNDDDGDDVSRADDREVEEDDVINDRIANIENKIVDVEVNADDNCKENVEQDDDADDKLCDEIVGQIEDDDASDKECDDDDDDDMDDDEADRIVLKCLQPSFVCPHIKLDLLEYTGDSDAEDIKPDVDDLLIDVVDPDNNYYTYTDSAISMMQKVNIKEEPMDNTKPLQQEFDVGLESGEILTPAEIDISIKELNFKKEDNETYLISDDETDKASVIVVNYTIPMQRELEMPDEEGFEGIIHEYGDEGRVIFRNILVKLANDFRNAEIKDDDLCNSKRKHSNKSPTDNILNNVLCNVLSEQYYENIYCYKNKRISISSSDDEQDSELARPPDDTRVVQIGLPCPDLKERMMTSADDYFPSPVRRCDSSTWENFLAMFLGNCLSVDPVKDHSTLCEIPDGRLSNTFQRNSAPRFSRPLYIYKSSLEEIQTLFDGLSVENEDQSYEDGLACSSDDVKFYKERKKCVSVMDEWISVRSPISETRREVEGVCNTRWFHCLHGERNSKVTLPSVEKTYHDFVASRFFLADKEDEVSRSGIPFLEDVEEENQNSDQLEEFFQIFKEFEALNWCKHMYEVELPPNHHLIQRKVFKDASKVMSIEIHTSEDPRLLPTRSSDSIYWPLTNRTGSHLVKSKMTNKDISGDCSLHGLENVHVTIYHSLNYDTVSSNTVNSVKVHDVSLPNLIKSDESGDADYKPELKHLSTSTVDQNFLLDSMALSNINFNRQDILKINCLENAIDVGIPCTKNSAPELLLGNFHNRICIGGREMYSIQNAKLLSLNKTFHPKLQDENLIGCESENFETYTKMEPEELSSLPIFVDKNFVSRSETPPIQATKINGWDVQKQKRNCSYEQTILDGDVKCYSGRISKYKYFQKFKSSIKFTNVCKSCKKFFIGKYLRNHASISQHCAGNKDKFLIDAILSLMCFENPQETCTNNSNIISKFLAYFREIPLNKLSSGVRNYFKLEKAIKNTATRIQKKNMFCHDMFLSALALNYNSRNFKITKNRKNIFHWRQENKHVDSIIHRSLANFNGEMDKILTSTCNNNLKSNGAIFNSMVSDKEFVCSNHFVNLSHFCKNLDQVESKLFTIKSLKRKLHKAITSSEHSPQANKMMISSNHIPTVDQNCENMWKKIKLNRNCNLNSKLNKTTKTFKLTATGGKLVHSRTTSSYLPDFLKIQSRTSGSPICKVSSSDEIVSNPFESVIVDIRGISVCSTSEVSNGSPECDIASTTSNDEHSVCSSDANISRFMENNKNHQSTINPEKSEILDSIYSTRPAEINHHYTILNVCGPPPPSYPFYRAHPLRPALQYPWSNVVWAVPSPPPFMTYPIRQAVPFCNSFIPTNVPPLIPGFYRSPPPRPLQFRHKIITPVKTPYTSSITPPLPNVRFDKNQTSDLPKYKKSTSFGGSYSKRIYVFNKDRSLSHNIEKFLQFKGALTFDPFNIVKLRNVPNIQCFVLVHFQDLNKLGQIPNILQLKRDLRVQFVIYKDVNDVKYQKFELIFPKGGVLVVEDETFLNLKADTFQRLCESLKKQIDENTKPWKIILNGTIKDVLKETKCNSSKTQNHKSLLNVLRTFEVSGLIHFSDFNFVSQSQKLEEYLNKCLSFQSTYCSKFRHFLFVTEKTIASEDSLKFTSRGIDILTIPAFARGFLSISIKISSHINTSSLVKPEASHPRYLEAVLSSSVVTL